MFHMRNPHLHRQKTTYRQHIKVASHKGDHVAKCCLHQHALLEL